MSLLRFFQSTKRPTNLNFYPLIIVSLLLVSAITCKMLGIIINTTSSMLRGIYIIDNSPIKRGDIVLFCLSEPYKTIGLERFYIGRSSKCLGAEPLIKKILAMPGDNVSLSQNDITVNGIKYTYPTLQKDSNGNQLKVFPRGNYNNTKDYWMVGTNTTNSWDSRYWGSIKQSQIISKIKLVLAW